MSRRLPIVVLLLIVGISGCGPADTAGRNRAIESALQPFGEIEVPTGSRLNLGGDGLVYLRKLEAAGLITIRDVPQGYWDNFASSTFMEGSKPYKVVETPKLAEVSLNPNLGSEGAVSDDRYTWKVRVAEPKVGEVLRDEEYKGPLATPGEKFRLVLAKIDNPLSTKRKGVPPELVKLLPGRLRCILKYSDFNKEWNVVAMDLGPGDSELWFTNNVR